MSEQLFQWLASVRGDPLAFTMGAFPWGKPGTVLENSAGPEDWACDLMIFNHAAPTEIYTATSAWVPISPFSTVATTALNIKTIQFVYPTATAVVAGVTVGIPNGQTATCLNHMALLPLLSTVATNSLSFITVAKEAGQWRLIGASY